MILFLSKTFLRHFHLFWHPGIQGFLIGTRNHFFFTPEVFVESLTISPHAIDQFLQTANFVEWELLGVTGPTSSDPLPGYVSLVTGSEFEPERWTATISLYNEEGLYTRPLQVRGTDIEEFLNERTRRLTEKKASDFGP